MASEEKLHAGEAVIPAKTQFPYAVGNMTINEVLTSDGLTMFSPKRRDYLITCEREALAVRGDLGEAVELARILDAAYVLGVKSFIAIQQNGGK